MKMFLLLILAGWSSNCIAGSKKDIVSAMQKLTNSRVVMTYENINLYRSSLNEHDSAFVNFGKEGIHTYRAYNAKYTFEVLRDSSQVTTPTSSFMQEKHSSFFELRYFRALINIEKRAGKFRLLEQTTQSKTYQFNKKKSDSYIELKLDEVGRIIQIIDRFIYPEYDMNDSTVISLRYVNEDIPQSYFKYSEPIKREDRLESVGENYYPFKSLSKLDSLTLLSGTPADSVRRVVIYGYLGCGPCHILKNYLKELTVDLDIPKDRIVVVNVYDEPNEILSYIERKKIPFTYYKAIKNYGSFSAPTIGFYNEQGKLVKTSFGASKTQARIMAFYISGADKALKLIKWEED